MSMDAHVTVDPRLIGSTVLEHTVPLAGPGSSDKDRFLGVQDLVFAVEEHRIREMSWSVAPVGGPRPYTFAVKELVPPRPYSWSLALMEMLVDPVLVRWVPEPVVEQYRRWNPFFLSSLREFDKDGP